jgi:transposase
MAIVAKPYPEEFRRDVVSDQPAGHRPGHRLNEQAGRPGAGPGPVEGASSYGAGLTRALQEAGISVYDVRPPRRTSQRGRGKSAAIDAVAAAQAVLGTEVSSLLQPRADGDRNALRILLDARRLMDRQRTADQLALTALVRTTALDVDGRQALIDGQIQAIAAWRTRPGTPGPSG